MFPNEKRCPRSYDKLRFDPSHPDCQLLTTHNDYSILTRLPRKKTAVITALRHPVDRVLSTYEFSIEVAARFLKGMGNRAADKDGAPRSISNTVSVSTLDIWPWRLLVPWMRDDLFRRRDARLAGLLDAPKEVLDPYDVSSFTMPIQEFIHHPHAFELVHNGATFQIAGLTNNSFFREARKIRSCVMQYPELGFHVLRVAKIRLHKMLYVGLTERHEKSAAAFATIVGGQFFSQWVTGKQSAPPGSHCFQVSETVLQNHTVTSPVHSVNSAKQPQHCIQELLHTYHTCVKSLRTTQASRKTVSLKNIAPVNFSLQSRESIPDNIAMEILHLNSLDADLYKYAETLFDKQEALLAESFRYMTIGDRRVTNSQLSSQSGSNNGSKDISIMTVTMMIFGMALMSFFMLSLMYLLILRYWRMLRLYFQKPCWSNENVRMKQ